MDHSAISRYQSNLRRVHLDDATPSVSSEATLQHDHQHPYRGGREGRGGMERKEIREKQVMMEVVGENRKVSVRRVIRATRKHRRLS